MATGQVITTLGKGIALNRTFLVTPTQTVPSQFKVGTGTTTPSIADTDVETVVAINGGNLKNFVSGFPTLDTVNNEATSRMFLNTLEANGNTLSEMGVFNSDGTPKMFSRVVFTGLAKTNIIELAFIQKDKIS